MGIIYVFFADGFEEIEAFTPIDVLRRAGLNVKLISVGVEEFVSGAHNVTVFCDNLFEDVSFDDAEMLILPGGMPGAENLSNHIGLRKLILDFNTKDKPIAAICAAPMVLGKLGLLKNKNVTCYPGFEHFLEGANPTGKLVEKDGNLITGKGPGAAMEFAFTILEYFCGKEKVMELKEGMIIQ